MPKTTVNKNCQSLFRKSKIWIAKQREIPSPAYNFIFTEDASKFDFRGFVSFRLNCSHDLRPLHFGNDIGHCDLIFAENLVEQDFDVVAGVPVHQRRGFLSWSGNGFFRSNFFRHAWSLENISEMKSVLPSSFLSPPAARPAAVVLVLLHRRGVAALGDGPLPHRLPIQTARARRHH